LQRGRATEVKLRRGSADRPEFDDRAAHWYSVVAVTSFHGTPGFEASFRA
jgi:hypothetical protein